MRSPSLSSVGASPSSLAMTSARAWRQARAASELISRAAASVLISRTLVGTSCFVSTPAAAAVHRAVGEAHARRQDWAPASTGGGGTSPVDDCGVHGRSIWLSPRAGATAAQGARLLLRRRHKGVAEPTVCSRLRISRPRICRSNFARSREKRTWRKKISATATRISSALTSAGVLISSGGDSEGGGGSGGGGRWRR